MQQLLHPGCALWIQRCFSCLLIPDLVGCFASGHSLQCGQHWGLLPLPAWLFGDVLLIHPDLQPHGTVSSHFLPWDILPRLSSHALGPLHLCQLLLEHAGLGFLQPDLFLVLWRVGALEAGWVCCFPLMELQWNGKTQILPQNHCKG